ncbi:MAG: helix-turn-helix domain-containing protein [Sphingobium sp.]
MTEMSSIATGARRPDSAAPARARQARETRAALIAAARQVFAEKGYHAAGTHEIVAVAKVTRGALQHHFPRKEDLFLAVFEQVQSDMIARAAQGAGPDAQGPDVEGDAERGTWPRLKADLIAYLQAATTPEVQRVVLTDGPAVLGWTEWRRLEAYYGLGIIMAGVEHGIAAGFIRPQPAAPLAHLILSVIDEAALMVANAQDPVTAMRDAQVALDTMLSHLA